MQYEQARDLVAAVARISSRPVVLFLDQWEKTPDEKTESHTLDAFLRHLGEWPACHIIMALTPDEPAAPPEARRYHIVEDLTKRWPGTAQLYPLERLDLEDAAARNGLLSFLNWRVPATRNVSEARVLALIDGYPRVIDQWTSDYWRERMHSVEDLEERAADAQKY